MMAARVQFKIHRQTRKNLYLFALLLAAVAALGFFLAILIPNKSNESRMGGGLEMDAALRGTALKDEALSPPLIEYREKLRPRATIGEVLSNYGFSPSETLTLCDQARPVYDLRRIRAGHELRLYAGPAGKIERLEYDLDEANYLVIERLENRFIAALKAHPIEIEIGLIGGIIEDSPILAFNRLGEDDALALAFADLFGWDVDFYIDIRQGDSFKVLFEKRYLKGKFAGYGHILAAELVNRGKVLQAFMYTSPDTQKPGHYDAEGKSLEKEFRKSPIKWARISSRFSSRRLHPIHQVYRAHYGVDYAAPVNTPVQATADGTVVSAEWNGASGRMIRLRHKNAYETMYLHLRSFAPGIKRGAKVKSGDVIGYVGLSGESTGPHLDYRIKLRGSYINPLSAKFAPVEPIKEEFLKDYRNSIGKYQLLLENPLVFVGPGLL
jgi:murein DD-endopeptidase MepM/ murein hydrolase activator NlpD